MSYDEDDYLALSGIQHFCFCRRQWALIHLEQMWCDDSRTKAGDIFHEKSDSGSKEKRKGVLSLRSVRLSSSELGLSGISDVIELIPGASDDPGSSCTVIPVEFKVGHKKSSDCDRVQLCAQAICIEEMMGVKVREGHIFYGSERRREKVSIDHELRDYTSSLAVEMHRMFKRGDMPSAEYTPMCSLCSLHDVCMPELNDRNDISVYMKSIGEYE